MSAGTADQPVTEEAAVTCAFLGHEAETHTDVGVAGLHRLMSRAEALDLKALAKELAAEAMSAAALTGDPLQDATAAGAGRGACPEWCSPSSRW